MVPCCSGCAVVVFQYGRPPSVQRHAFKTWIKPAEALLLLADFLHDAVLGRRRGVGSSHPLTTLLGTSCNLLDVSALLCPSVYYAQYIHSPNPLPVDNCASLSIFFSLLSSLISGLILFFRALILLIPNSLLQPALKQSTDLCPYTDIGGQCDLAYKDHYAACLGGYISSPPHRGMMLSFFGSLYHLKRG